MDYAAPFGSGLYAGDAPEDAGSNPASLANINVSMTGNWYTRATNCMSNGKG